MQWIRTHLKVVVPAVVVAVVGVAYLAFGVFAIQTLFIDDKVDEAGPIFDSGADAGVGVDITADSLAVDTQVTVSVPLETVADETPSSDAAPPATESPATPEQAEIVALREGSFVSRSHPGEGLATVLTDGSDQRFLRFEQFSTDNGPDLNVYLTIADADAPEGDFAESGQFIDLGGLKGNIGDQNYEIPPDVDLERFDTVVVWCVRFSVAFTAADLI
jgi:hypothetical protein